MQNAVVNHSSLSDADIVLAVEACNQQAIEAAHAYGIDPTVVVFYGDTKDLPQKDCRIVDIVDDLEQPGADGFHTDDGGIEYARVQAQGADTWITLSHEILEMQGDPTCATWSKMPDGKEVAFEVCDPVEGDSYAVSVALTIGTEVVTKDIRLSNYVLPSWFNADATGPVDRMQTLNAPLSMSQGGYMVVRGADGTESDVFAHRVRFGGWSARATVGSKIANPDSRLRTRLNASRR